MNIPYKVIENAVKELRSTKQNPDKFGFTVEDGGTFWSVLFQPLAINVLGGDVEMYVSKKNFKVIKVLLYQ